MFDSGRAGATPHSQALRWAPLGQRAPGCQGSRTHGAGAEGGCGVPEVCRAKTGTGKGLGQSGPRAGRRAVCAVLRRNGGEQSRCTGVPIDSPLSPGQEHDGQRGEWGGDYERAMFGKAKFGAEKIWFQLLKSCKIWYKIPRLWHKNKHTPRICTRFLGGCCYFLMASGCLLRGCAYQKR